MGLQFYVGEIQAQINEATRMNSEAQQAISTLQTSISQFLSAPLSGKAYTSAKNYFSVAFTPLCRSAIMTGEALAQAHKKLLSEYQGSVSSIDTNEDEILEQINQFEQLKRSLEEQMRTAKTMRPDLEKRYMNACDCIKKRREKLQKFHDYNSKSASFFSAFDSSLSEFKTGLAQVQHSKAWNASTGTFDLGLLDMSWAVGINERWKNREEAIAKQKEEWFNKNVKQLEGYTIYAWPYEDPVTGEVTISWFIDKNGRRLDNKELQAFLEQHGTELDPSYYQIVDWKKIRDLENDALRRGETYITGQKYQGLSKNSMQLSGYISTGYAFAQDSGLYELAMIAGLSYAGAKSTGSTPKKSSGAKSSGEDIFNYTNKVNEHMTNPDRAVPAQTLKEAIKGGTPMPDPRGSSATMYYSEIYINGKKYNFEVLYDKATNTIYHFKYDRRPLGPLPAVPKQ
ncbi:T7SS effector LXG polymorphic toxin [Microbacterium sp.]|uniref:T7SS effector LXG polymorphic toxin n=1 Tax=Microbacterium sp. TaxID=51671 RepID=UPI0028B10995|nr:T7SS effector LXG polymorphic toxin [Microbacterium sp.]